MMNFMQLFTTFLALNKRQQNDFHSQNSLGNDQFHANPNLQSDMIKLPAHQDHFERFTKPETHFDVGFNVRPTPPRLFTPINNDFLKTLPHFQDNLFANNLRNNLGRGREQNFRSVSMRDVNRRRDEQLLRNTGIVHRFEEHVPRGVDIPVPLPAPSDSLFANIPPAVDIDAILAGLHVADNVPLRCDVMCGDSVHCPFGYLQEFCPRCQCAPDPCLLNPCFSQYDTCVAVPNLNCIDENKETCPYEARCEEIGCGCPAYWQPVCGTDRNLFGRTYVNNCAMTCIPGTQKIYDGECWPSHISRYFFTTTTTTTRRPRPTTPVTVTTVGTTPGTARVSVDTNVTAEVSVGTNSGFPSNNTRVTTTEPMVTTTPPISMLVTTESVPPPDVPRSSAVDVSVLDSSSKILSSATPIVDASTKTAAITQSMGDRTSTSLEVGTKQAAAADKMMTSPMKKSRTKLTKQSLQDLELMLSENGLASKITKGSGKMDFVTRTVQTLPTAAADHLGGSLDAELASFDALLNEALARKGMKPGIV